ncbi:MAG: inositol 2-dehydrogenase [Verrucomicrobia bacterium]|nr:inositol 2-dehydrogenase [Verrucomicrobiota bacterium]
MLKVAVVGTGFIGSVHAKNIARHPGAELVAVSDPNIEAAKKIAATTGAKVVADITEILNNESIQAVLIATPTDTHVDYLKRAANAGKAIYCEKPIGLDYAEAKQAVRTVSAAGVPVMLGFNRRFDASHAAVKQAVDRGDVGKVEIVQLTSRGPKPPPISYVKVSGGQLRDQTIHFFDLLRWLTNDEPVEVYAIGAALVDPAIGEAGDVDTSIVSIRMDSGAFCQIDSSRRAAYGYDERVEVFGSEGLVESQRQSFRGVSLYKGQQIFKDGLHPGWFERIEQSYYEAIDAFFRSIEKGTPPSPSLEDGLKAQLIADKATESMKTGQPVKIQF